MRKILFTTAIVAIMLSMSCNNGNTGNENNGNGNTTEPKYLTVTYHLGEYFTGDPPIDPKKYAVGDKITLFGLEGMTLKDKFHGRASISGWAYTDQNGNEQTLPIGVPIPVKELSLIDDWPGAGPSIPPMDLHLYPKVDI